MSDAYLLHGVDVFDGERMLGAHDVLVSSGQVAELTAPGKVSGGSHVQTLDCEGLLLLPGMTDLHCHLRDPGQTHKEDLVSGTRAAAAGGFTTVVCMPNTTPPIDNPVVAAYIRDKAQREGFCRVSPAGALSRSRGGEQLAELAGLYAAGVRLFTDDGSDTARADVFFNALRFLSMLPGARALIHAETPELARGVMHDGTVSAELGHAGNPALGEDIATARALLTALAAGQPTQITHIASAGALELVRWAKQQAAQRELAGLITADATFNHLLLTDEAIRDANTLAKINPPLRSEADRAALLEALADGTLDALTTDHAPHTADEKNQELDAAPSGFVGFEVALGLLLEHVAGQETPAGVITRERVLEYLTSRPAAILAGAVGCSSAPAVGDLTELNPVVLPVSPGRIAPGLSADLVLLDPQERWTVVPQQFYSRSRNTPFSGWQARGRILLTLCGGRVRHSAGSFGHLEASAGGL